MSNMDVRNDFYEFGKNMQIVAICTVLSIVTGVTSLIALIFIFIALGNIKKANLKLNNEYLEEFRLKYVRAFILRICGTIVLMIGVINLVFFFFIPSDFDSFWITISISVILILAGLTFGITSVVAEMKAWKNLKRFFEENRSMFPGSISHELIDGCDKLKTAALLNALGFLIITAIIGFIYQIIGYFKLAKLNTLLLYDVPKTSPIQVNLPESRSISINKVASSFCPNCGTKLSGLGKFCPLCGSDIS
ncbi:hypothetical protein ES707_10457 [subsurface metagenome]